MSTQKITDLTSQTTPDDADVFVHDDVDVPETKKITASDLKSYMQQEVFLKDGSVTATGDFNLGSQSLNNVDEATVNAAKLVEQAGDPTNEANRGFVYAKDASGTTELFYIDDSGNVTQMTSGGELIEHASRHATGGGDAIAPSDIGAAPERLNVRTITGDGSASDLHNGDWVVADTDAAAGDITITVPDTLTSGTVIQYRLKGTGGNLVFSGSGTMTPVGNTTVSTENAIVALVIESATVSAVTERS